MAVLAVLAVMVVVKATPADMVQLVDPLVAHPVPVLVVDLEEALEVDLAVLAAIRAAPQDMDPHRPVVRLTLAQEVQEVDLMEASEVDLVVALAVQDPPGVMVAVKVTLEDMVQLVVQPVPVLEVDLMEALEVD